MIDNKSLPQSAAGPSSTSISMQEDSDDSFQFPKVLRKKSSTFY